MQELNIKGPDINNDGDINELDIKILQDSLIGMTPDEKRNYVHSVNNALFSKENINSQALDELKNLFISNSDLLENPDLKLLYEALFVKGGDLIQLKKFFTFENLLDYFKKEIIKYGISKNEYEEITSMVGIDNLFFLYENNINFIVTINNIKKYENKLSLKTIYYLGDINIDSIDIENTNILKQIELITDKGVFIDKKVFMNLKDMGIGIEDINTVEDKDKKGFSILLEKGIKLDNIVELVEKGFPISEYSEYIDVNNVKLFTILFNRMEAGYSNIDSIKTIFLRIDKILSILENGVISNNNIGEITLIIEGIDEYYEGYGNILDNINKKALIECKNVFKNADISSIIGVFDRIYIPIALDDYQIIELYKSILNKDDSLTILDIGIIISKNLSITEYLKSITKDEKNFNESDENNITLDEKISIKLKQLDISTDFFNKFLSKIILNGNTKINKNESGSIDISGGNYEKEFILDILRIKGLKDFIIYLSDNKSSINILGKKIEVSSNIQFIKDILEYKEINKNLNTEKDFGKVINLYSRDLNSFLELPKIKDSVLVTFQANTFMGGDDSGAFSGEKGILKEIFKDSEHIDLSITSKEKKQSPEDIIKNLETILKNKVHKEIIFYIGVHGSYDGSAGYSGGKIDKSFFTKLNDLANKYPNFKAKIDSCYSGIKFDKSNINGNIYYTSENQTATSEITDVLESNKKDIDYNNDGEASLKEVVFSEMLDYNDSLLSNSGFHSFVKRKNGKIRNIPGNVNFIFFSKNIIPKN